jgi:N-acetylmuramic acid 6-phosphate etherase
MAGPPSSESSRYESLLTEQRNPQSTNIDKMSILEMVDLINDQDRRVPEAVHAVRKDLARGVGLVEKSLRQGGRLVYIGAGTSGRLGVVDASECPPTFGTDPAQVQGVIAGGKEAVFRSQEYAEDDPVKGAEEMDRLEIDGRDTVCGIASSGMTPYVLGAIRRARELGASTILVTCTPAKEHQCRADCVIAPLVGPEVITGSTRMKAGTATKLVLNTLTTAAMVRIGKTYENLMVDLQTWCRKLEDRGCRIMQMLTGASRDRAKKQIDRAGGRLKLAIVMELTGAEPEEAQAFLDRAGGVARRAIEAARSHGQAPAGGRGEGGAG